MTVHIGISGPIAAGKSTLAKGLAEVLGLMGKKANIIPFATGLKYLATLSDNPQGYLRAYEYFIGLGYSEDKALAGTKMLIEGFIKHPVRNGVKPRQLFQFIGTEVGRETVDKNIWIKDVQRKIANDPVDFVISDDMRFVNESAAVHLRIAITLEEKEKEYELRQALFPKEYFFSDHPSEKERNLLYAPDFEVAIDNKTTDVIKLARDILHWTSERKMFELHVTPFQQATEAFSGVAKVMAGFGFIPTVVSGAVPDGLDLNAIKPFDMAEYKKAALADYEYPDRWSKLNRQDLPKLDPEELG